MDYEKKYKDALERAREQYNKRTPLYDIESIFPELQEKESEDKRMKKAIMHVLYENYSDAAVIEGVEIAEIAAWLEKQGEKDHWISVEDELPPMSDENGTSDIVLTHSKGGVIYMNRYDYRGNTWGNPLAFNATHWMPLPQAPTVAKNATVKKGGKE